MSTYLFLPLIIALSIGLLTLSITVRTLYKEIDELKEVVEYIRKSNTP